MFCLLTKIFIRSVFVMKKYLFCKKLPKQFFLISQQDLANIQSDKGDSSISLADVVNMIPKNSDKV